MRQLCSRTTTRLATDKTNKNCLDNTANESMNVVIKKIGTPLTTLFDSL